MQFVSLVPHFHFQDSILMEVSEGEDAYVDDENVGEEQVIVTFIVAFLVTLSFVNPYLWR